MVMMICASVNVLIMTPSAGTARRRPVTFAAAVLGWVMLAIYVTVIAVQGDATVREILPWALIMAIAALAATGSVVSSRLRLARILMVAAALLYATLGVLSILSIGIGFLLAAVLAAGSLIELSRQ